MLHRYGIEIVVHLKSLSLHLPLANKKLSLSVSRKKNKKTVGNLYTLIYHEYLKSNKCEGSGSLQKEHFSRTSTDKYITEVRNFTKSQWLEGVLLFLLRTWLFPLQLPRHLTNVRPELVLGLLNKQIQWNDVLTDKL